MKKAKTLITIAFVLAMICSIGAAVANYTGHEESAVAGYPVSFDNYITSDKKNCGASTSAGNSVVWASVSVSYYWYDPIGDHMYSNGRGNGSQGGAGAGGPELTGALNYYKIISDHVATYQNMGCYCNDLTTIAP